METINYAINYIKLLEGVKYTLSNDNNSFTSWENVKDIGPFWIGKKPLPRNDKIINQGICCVGLINLMRRLINLDIPAFIDSETNESKFIGGTCGWFQYLNKLKRLEPIDINKIYPKGTLLIQDYNPIDQGHVAVVLSENKILKNSRKIHAIGGINSNKYNCVIREKFMDYPNWRRYTHVCLPHNWLLKN